MSKEANIRQAVIRSGFPLQLEIAHKLNERGYDVSNSVYFFDRDEKKARELDIETFMNADRITASLDMEGDKWYFNPALIIECKKSEQLSWIFYDSNPINFSFDIGHSIDFLTAKKGYEKSIGTKVLSHGFVEHYNTYKYIAGCKQQVRNKDGQIINSNVKGKGGKDEILDALSKLIKYMDYQFDRLKGFFEDKPIRKDVLFFFPIIVFSGDLYFASYKKELEVRESKHILYETRYFSSLTGGLVPLYVDIVRKDAFLDLIKLIEGEVIEINAHLRKPEVQKELNCLANDL